jgi:hypothetical protein
MSDMERRWREAKIGERRDGRVCVWVECEGDPRAEVLAVLAVLRSMPRGARVTAEEVWPHGRFAERTTFTPSPEPDEPGVGDAVFVEVPEDAKVTEANAIAAGGTPLTAEVTPDGAAVAVHADTEPPGLDSEAALLLRRERAGPPTLAGDMEAMTRAAEAVRAIDAEHPVAKARRTVAAPKPAAVIKPRSSRRRK